MSFIYPFKKLFLCTMYLAHGWYSRHWRDRNSYFLLPWSSLSSALDVTISSRNLYLCVLDDKEWVKMWGMTRVSPLHWSEPPVWKHACRIGNSFSYVWRNLLQSWCKDLNVISVISVLLGKEINILFVHLSGRLI